MTSDLELPIVVDGILMPREIVTARKDRSTRFSCTRIDLVAFVGTRLIVSRCIICRGLEVLL